MAIGVNNDFGGLSSKDRQSIIKDINKALGHQSLVLASEDSVTDSKGCIPTGIVPLDAMLGGGVPRGRFIELYGTQQHGKTTLTLQIAKECQKIGGEVIYFDAEESLDKGRSGYMGLDLSRLFMLAPEPWTVEQAVVELINNVRKIRAKTDGPILFIWDTLANTPHGIEAKMVDMTVEEQKKQKYSEGMNPRPQLIRTQLRKLTRFIAENDVTVIFINHLIQNLRPYGEQQITTGGDALKYASTLRVKVKRKEPLKEDNGEDVFGYYTDIELTKSKVCMPWRSVSVPLLAESGFDADMALLEAMAGTDERMPIKRNSSYFNVDMNGTKISFQLPSKDRERIAGLKTVLSENAGLREFLTTKAYELLAPPWWKEKNMPKAEEPKAEKESKK